jgi:hypothetical protein
MFGAPRSCRDYPILFRVDPPVWVETPRILPPNVFARMSCR